MTALSVPKLILIRKTRNLSVLFNCVQFPAPTLRDVELSHGELVAVGLIRMLLINLNDSLNQNRMSNEQIYEAACLMYEEAADLKITEMYEFFVRIKKGLYGEYYGSLDVVKVMTDFSQFQKERALALRKVKEVEHRRQLNEEWERRKRIFNESIVK